MSYSSMASRLRHRRGSVFIAVAWLIIVLTALAITLAQTISVESITAANTSSQAQAAAIELGAEQWVLAQVDGNNNTNLYFPGDSVTITQIPCEALQVGDGYFWILAPNFNDPDGNFEDAQQYNFGITSESAKLNLNTATAAALALLPGLNTSDNSAVPTSIIAWRGNGQPPAATTTPLTLTPGIPATPVTLSTSPDENVYMTLPDPYHCKNSAFETVDEALLVNGVTPVQGTPPAPNTPPDILHGFDINQNCVFEDAEVDAGGDPNNVDNGTMGFAPFVTVYSAEPNISNAGVARVSVNSTSSQLTTLLQQNLSAASYATLNRTLPRLRPFSSILDFYIRTGITASDFALIADQITTTSATTTTTTTSGTTTTTATTPGLIDVNTASYEVLATLPGLVDSDIQSLMSARQTADTTTIAWVATAISQAKATAIGSLVTIRSFQYSADIVAVSGDGRAFKRVRIVVDCQQSPPKIIYRKDLTRLGWPLDPQVRTDMRAGQAPPLSSDTLSMKGGT